LAYAVSIAASVWSQDKSIAAESAWVQFLLLLSALNIIRGTRAIAVIGCFIPVSGSVKQKFLRTTTFLAVMVDVLSIAGAFGMAWYINNTAPHTWTGIPLPVIEFSIFAVSSFAFSCSSETLILTYFE
jgi:hypothetical protein